MSCYTGTSGTQSILQKQDWLGLTIFRVGALLIGFACSLASSRHPSHTRKVVVKGTTYKTIRGLRPHDLDRIDAWLADKPRTSVEAKCRYWISVVGQIHRGAPRGRIAKSMKFARAAQDGWCAQANKEFKCPKGAYQPDPQRRYCFCPKGTLFNRAKKACSAELVREHAERKRKQLKEEKRKQTELKKRREDRVIKKTVERAYRARREREKVRREREKAQRKKQRLMAISKKEMRTNRCHTEIYNFLRRILNYLKAETTSLNGNMISFSLLFHKIFITSPKGKGYSFRLVDSGEHHVFVFSYMPTMLAVLDGKKYPITAKSSLDRQIGRKIHAHIKSRMLQTTTGERLGLFVWGKGCTMIVVFGKVI